MKLILDRHDLRPEHYSLPAAKVDFRCFTKKAMEAIIASNGALFEYGDSSFIAIKTKFPRRPTELLDEEQLQKESNMSTYVQVIAQTRLSSEDFRKVKLYNSLINDYDPPADLKSDVRHIIGPSFDDGAPVPVPRDGLVEIPLQGRGRPEELRGMVIDITSIPPATFAIRIYLD